MITGFWNRLFKRGGVSVGPVLPHNDVSVWINSRGVGMDVCGALTVDYNPVTREEFDAYLKGAKIDDLKSEIERNRRNKKKVSHLVAERDKAVALLRGNMMYPDDGKTATDTLAFLARIDAAE